MQYGYFDDNNKEYVVSRPDTPRSWSNYLGSTEYGAIITNNAGGYSFYKSSAQGRFVRLMFNAIPTDQPGRYLYIHDKESKDFWSGSWQPVGKPLDQYKSECRHGAAYTVITSEYTKIQTETLYFVPLGENFECWKVKIRNSDNKIRKLSLFTYIEYANNWNAACDLDNLQYSQYILKMDYSDGLISHGTNVNLPPEPDNFQEQDQGRFTFIGIAGAEVTGFDTDREIFIGPYRSYHNPLIVEKGKCSGSLAVGDNGCGTLQVDVDLQPDEEKEFVVIMGIGKAEEEGRQAIRKYSDINVVDKEFRNLKEYWHNRIEGMSVRTPDPEFNSMTNMWSPFNCLMTYAWSRAASLIYTGARDGLGYRDTVQDLLGVLHTIPEEAGERLELMITGQCSTGGAMPVVKPFAHYPGKEKNPEEYQYRSDDCLWLFNTIPAYVKETGNISFYNKILPYADRGEDTVFGHLKRAIEFNLERSGNHGLPCGLSADWNDCLELGQKGETVFVAFQLRYALKTYLEIADLLKNTNEAEWAEKELKILDDNLEKHAWDGEWYLRAYKDSGMKFGTKEDKEGSIWLNPQTWAVYSGHTTKDKGERIMKAVHERLATKYGIMVCAPPYLKTDHRVIKAPYFNPGMKENGSIFCHTQGWVIIAETMLGHGNQAYKYYRSFMPAAYNTKAEIREIEPYVFNQSTHSVDSPRFGASRLPWLSGAATWAYYSATRYILGIQPQYDGIKLDPCIPTNWEELEIKRKFRNKILEIKIDNSKKVEKGVEKLIVNGETFTDNFIPAEILKDQNEIKITMG